MAQTHWDKIAEHYRTRILSGELKPGDRILSDAKLAEQWGVSRPTAHRALHELQRLGLVLRSKGTGTVVAERGGTAKGRVAVIVDRYVPRVNFPNSDLMRGIQDGLGEEVNVVLAHSNSEPSREARLIEKLRLEADAILIYPVSDPANNRLIQRVYDSGTPLVVLDRFPEGLHVDTVVSDNFGATESVIRALVERGHERIGFISFHKPDFSSVSERHDAYLSVVGPQGNGLTRWFPSAIELQPPQLVQAVQDAVYALVYRDKVTAFFCVEDILAAAVMDAAESLGMRIPEDLAVALFNDWPPMMLRSAWNLFRVVQNMHGIGLAAASLANERLERASTERRVIRVAADLFIPA